MRLKRKTVFVAGTGALVAALGGLASLSAQGAAAAAPRGDRRAGGAAGNGHGPSGNQARGARGEAAAHDRALRGRFHVACYEPGQLEQAYNLWPLYQQG